MFLDCGSYWWANLILVNDFVPADRAGVTGCMTWTTYIAIEIKLFFFLPFLLLLYKKKKTVGLVVLWSLVVVGNVICFAVIYVNNFIPGYFVSFDTSVTNLYGIKPYVRIDSYAFGILLALFY
jgi:hypothetical protein